MVRTLESGNFGGKEQRTDGVDRTNGRRSDDDDKKRKRRSEKVEDSAPSICDHSAASRREVKNRGGSTIGGW
ncbi:hypothetical protein PRIPAC_75106, partial [Pristionchus pacificus]|uniref:Uncharacterized protein n=1 Tax=Pristionchus pacificus TaxID=54126 RepID=A0A2A6CQQ3_PRIPA